MTDNNKHLVRAGHEFAAAMSDDTPIITIAKMVTKLASALDVQSARSEALTAKLNDVCAENAALKSVIGECQRYFIAGIRNAIRPTNEGYLHMRCDTVADETPNTDAWVNEQRAVGATRVETNLRACYEEFPESSRDIVDECIQIAANAAAQLRGSKV
ncbi:hypothetical protein [Atlantibacter sp. RC6]|uniref:hypothetical protein n=1 Tax=Atlantibacter sp. RC6 TaxID=2587036 RepID=UPI0016065EE1|nr:hypothetical protein [Atlantibacter sp. RC6]MBB3320956.1 hypothetical protein [Atlantibacter sp. RC6]